MLHACDNCGTTILFGGLNDGGQRYCNPRCHELAQLARRSAGLAPELVARAVAEVAHGDCPVCSGPGPVEAFTSYRVLSLVAVTTWQSLPRISCRRCATKAQIGSLVYSLFLGWWGIPWGFLLTPVQIARNLAGLARAAEREQPSALLEALVRVRLAAAAPAAPPESVRRAA